MFAVSARGLLFWVVLASMAGCGPGEAEIHQRIDEAVEITLSSVPTQAVAASILDATGVAESTDSSVPTESAFGSQFGLMFEGQEGAVVNEVWLEVPGELTDVGAPVQGSGHLEPLHQPGDDCDLFEFEFRGSIQPWTSSELVEMRGVAERRSYCGGDVGHDAGDFEVTITGEGSIMGTIIFADDPEPHRMTGAVPAPSAGSTFPGRIPTVFWLFATALALDLAATAVCFLKGRRAYALIGVAASILSAAFSFEAREVDPGVLEDLVLMFLFVGLVLPLTVLVVFGAFQPARPSSRWAKRASQDQ